MNPNGNAAFDGSGVGAFMEVVDDVTSETVRLTTVDIYGFESGEFGVTQASDGVGHTTSIIYGNSSGNINALGIGSVDDSIFSNQSRDFNPREAWEISFNTDVYLDNILFESWSSGDTVAGFTISSSVFVADIDLSRSDLSSDYFNFDSGVFVPADTPIKIAMTGSSSSGENSVRIESLEVTAVPEPSAFFLASLGGLLLARRARP